MTRDDVKLDLKRWGAIVGVIGGSWLLLTALRNEADERYVPRREYQDDLSAIRSDLRVLRCELVKDCSKSSP